MTMLANVCPNCGKVCPANAKVCPVCHHSLPVRSNPEPNIKDSPTRHNKKLLRGLGLVAIVVGIVIFVVLCKNLTTADAYYRYEGLVVSGYDQSGRLTRRWCYVIKGENFYGKSQANFSIAYLGNHEAAVKNKGTSNLAKAYRRAPHYELRVTAHRATFTGPQLLKIPIKGRSLLGSDKTGLQWPDGYLRNLTNDSRVVKVKIDRIFSNSTI